MASIEQDPTQPTKDQASQTQKSLEGTSNTEQSQNYQSNSDFSPLTGQSERPEVSGPDQTVPKVSVEEPEQSKDDNDTSTDTYDRHQDDQCRGQGAEDRADGNSRDFLQDHQCAHAESLISEEHTLHHAKQEQGQGSSKPLLRTGSSFEEEDYLRYALDCSRSVSSLSRSQSSAFSMLTCDTCSAADKSLLCSRSKEFWRGVESSKCCEKIWKHFSDRLKEDFPNEPALHQGRVMHLLKTLLGVNDSLQNVSISKYLQLVKFMGPFRLNDTGDRCVVLEQLEDLVHNSCSKDPKNKKKKVCWFAAYMTREEAEGKLKGKAPGTFLIRMSATEKEEANFALSLMMANSEIEHFRLEGHHKKAIESNPFSLCLKFRGETYSSLPELVNYLRSEEIDDGDSDNATTCKFVCPDLPFNQVINGYAK